MLGLWDAIVEVSANSTFYLQKALEAATAANECKIEELRQKYLRSMEDLSEQVAILFMRC